MRSAREYRNIVFDMGHVLSEYDSRRAIAQFTDDEAVIKEIRYVLYCSCEWQMLDTGIIDEDTALRYTLRRLSSDAVREIARKSFAHWEDYNLWPKPGMDEVVKAVKARGQNAYVLSNAGMRLTRCWRRAALPGSVRRRRLLRAGTVRQAAEVDLPALLRALRAEPGRLPLHRRPALERAGLH